MRLYEEQRDLQIENDPYRHYLAAQTKDRISPQKVQEFNSLTFDKRLSKIEDYLKKLMPSIQEAMFEVLSEELPTTDFDRIKVFKYMIELSPFETETEQENSSKRQRAP